MNKITLISNRNYSVKKFRKNLIEELKKDYEVSLIIVDDTDERIEIDGVDIYYVSDNNRDINPLNKIHLKNKIEKLLKQINPNKVFTFQITPNTFGVLAAKKCKINDIYSMIEGVGDVFINNTLYWKIIRLITLFLYKVSLKNCKKIFFICNDDKDEFIKRGLVKNRQCVVINGVGIDLDYFKYKDIKNTNTYVMIARMSPTKGVIEYCEAAKLIKQKYPNTIFNYVGEEFTLKKQDIQKYIDSGTINYLGYKDDIRPYLENSFINVLPSYREGFGLVIAEAGAVGRASIASRTQGCKDAIVENKTGLLFDNKDYKDLANKIEYSIKHKEELINMGINARKLAENEYDQTIINAYILKEIQNV